MLQNVNSIWFTFHSILFRVSFHWIPNVFVTTSWYISYKVINCILSKFYSNPKKFRTWIEKWVFSNFIKKMIGSLFWTEDTFKVTKHCDERKVTDHEQIQIIQSKSLWLWINQWNLFTQILISQSIFYRSCPLHQIFLRMQVLETRLDSPSPKLFPSKQTWVSNWYVGEMNWLVNVTFEYSNNKTFKWMIVFELLGRNVNDFLGKFGEYMKKRTKLSYDAALLLTRSIFDGCEMKL